MAITVKAQILGQEATLACTYCYLFEPMRVFIEESSLTAKKLYITVRQVDTGNGAVGPAFVKYAAFDINPGVGITVDLMKIAQQLNDAGAWKFGTVTDIVTAEGYRSVIAQFRYKFYIHSDVNWTPVIIYKLPLNGARELGQFVPLVNIASPINEFQYYGLNENLYRQRWPGTTFLTTQLVSPTLNGSVRPIITRIVNAGDPPCGGFLLWKSRFGGWMFWGFDIQTEQKTKRYEGSLEVGMFESTLDKDGDVYIPVDYTGINTSYSRTLKSLGLSSKELQAVSGIHASQAVYYQYPGTEKIELMRLTSHSAPLSTLSSGGDFSVSLKSISTSSQLTI